MITLTKKIHLCNNIDEYAQKLRLEQNEDDKEMLIQGIISSILMIKECFIIDLTNDQQLEEFIKNRKPE